MVTGGVEMPCLLLLATEARRTQRNNKKRKALLHRHSGAGRNDELTGSFPRFLRVLRASVVNKKFSLQPNTPRRICTHDTKPC